MARTKRVVVDAAVKTDGRHGPYVKSTRAPANTSPTLTTSGVVASGRWTDLGVPVHREGGAILERNRAAKPRASAHTIE
jgi:hypothetical protein